ncbi:GSCFA domain-containing protein [Hoylesella shahii]|jgi:lipoprotein|uniref:GSCFA domain-containing protein n=1 Tax=Hoylesella shahii TaxID=228603 RepID=UPI001CB2DAFA|nr:GSCFA domain-containing protein [Hoylesella shahii]MBF1575220.1 GSCFA domain-containing protein [Hoylesella shahii]
MQLQTQVAIPRPLFAIEPFQKVLLVGSCFAQNMGKRFSEAQFQTTVNPFGVMYNPGSILHTVQRCTDCPAVAIFTLGTNRVYCWKETGEIADNCKKLPQKLFDEKELTIDQCVSFLNQAIEILKTRNPQVQVVITVSPIRYAKYGFVGSQLSKATLILATHRLLSLHPDCTSYFPAYEIMNDELRDYRFYAPDMLHPTEQAVEYIWEQFSNSYFSPLTHAFLKEWQPLKAALSHKPFDAEGAEYKAFLEKTLQQIKALENKYQHPINLNMCQGAPLNIKQNSYTADNNRLSD